MGKSSNNLNVTVNTDFDDIRSQAWRRSWGVNVLCEKMFHLPVKACPGQLTDTTNTGLLNTLSCDWRRTKEPIIANFGKIVDSSRILVKTQKLATTCIADHSVKSRVVQAVGFMVKPLDLVHHGVVQKAASTN